MKIYDSGNQQRFSLIDIESTFCRSKSSRAMGRPTPGWDGTSARTLNVKKITYSEDIRQPGGQPARRDSGYARAAWCSRSSHCREEQRTADRCVSGTHVGSRLSPPGKRSECETNTDCRSNVVVVEIGDAGAMRNGDGQTAGHVGTRNSGKNVQTLGEVIIHI
jgi:hypothetical protein